jgi:hypothetical protein
LPFSRQAPQRCQYEQVEQQSSTARMYSWVTNELG